MHVLFFKKVPKILRYSTKHDNFWLGVQFPLICLFYCPSAGGSAVVLHIDHVKTLLPDGVPLHGLVDAGIFLAAENLTDFDHFRVCSQSVSNLQQVFGKILSLQEGFTFKRSMAHLVPANKKNMGTSVVYTIFSWLGKMGWWGLSEKLCQFWVGWRFFPFFFF